MLPAVLPVHVVFFHLSLELSLCFHFSDSRTPIMLQKDSWIFAKYLDAVRSRGNTRPARLQPRPSKQTYFQSFWIIGFSFCQGVILSQHFFNLLFGPKDVIRKHPRQTWVVLVLILDTLLWFQRWWNLQKIITGAARGIFMPPMSEVAFDRYNTTTRQRKGLSASNDLPEFDSVIEKAGWNDNPT